MGLALQAFTVCEKDGVSGLTWAEVDSCNVSFCYSLCPCLPDFKPYFRDNFAVF